MQAVSWWLGSLIALGLVATACSGSTDGAVPTVVGGINDFSPPGDCEASTIPVDLEEAPFVFLVCGQAYEDPLYPTPMSWFGDGATLEQALEYLVKGSPARVSASGLWSGFDYIPDAERSSLVIDVTLSDSGVADISIANADGVQWQPPPELFERVSDSAMFTDVLAATALGFDQVSAVRLSVCPAVGPPADCGPIQRSTLQARRPPNWAVGPDCGLLDLWLIDECRPANR